MIGQTISHYKILEKLGQGGMGIIYKAKDENLKRFVALKFLPQNLTLDRNIVAQFMREAQTASSLDHQNICTIYEISETNDGRLYIAMAYYGGESLRKKIERSEISFHQARNIILQLCNGLARAHERGIIHGVVKPENIIITNDQVVKILELGLAKVAEREQMTGRQANQGTIGNREP